jgi:putative transposase
MATQRRKFTDDQKLEILQEAEKMGVSAVLRAHSLSYSVFAKWKQKFMKPDNYPRGNVLTGRARSELKLLIEENTRLKKIIADMALELERKDEELRKGHTQYGKR